MSDRDPAEAGVIVATPGVVSGRPRLAGTRIYTMSCWGFYKAGYDVAGMLREYPDLDRVDVLAAVAFELGRRYERRKRKHPKRFVALPMEVGR